MKTIYRSIIVTLLFLGAAAAMGPRIAGAAGTPAGQAVTNTATASYSVNGVPQAAHPTASATFVVDDKVMFTVTADNGGAVTIEPAGKAALQFTVTNIGNNTHDFALVATQLTGTTVASPVIADKTDGTSATLKSSGSSTVFIDELAPGASQVVYIVVTANGTAPNGLLDNFSLAAIAHCADTGAGTCGAGLNSLGALSVNTSGDKSATSISMGTMFTVLAEGHGNGAGDVNYDGQFIQNGVVGFQIAAPIVNLAKSSVVYKDPVCDLVPGCTTPRAIPGATVTYTLTVSNNGPAAASALSISDSLPSFVTYVAYSAGALTCAASEVVIDGACSGTVAGTTVSIAGSPQVVSVSGLTVDATGGAHATRTIKYMVTIN